jgi:hypothetical protein
MAAPGNPKPIARISRGRNGELRLIHDSFSGSPTVVLQALKNEGLGLTIKGRFSLWISEIPAVLEALESAWEEAGRGGR